MSSFLNVFIALSLLFSAHITFAQSIQTDNHAKPVFAKDNLVAWCIVPFDTKKRGPETRAKMLRDLGIKKMAYDWRQEHIPTFAEELDMLEKYGIELTAFWIPINLDPQSNNTSNHILDLLKKKDVQTQIWITLDDSRLEPMSQDERVKACAEAIGFIANKAAEFDSQVALYNHGGWFGQPENQIEIIKEMNQPNVGTIYCFHHGHEHLDRFPELFQLMKPYLLTLSLNGMKKDGPKILPIGQGDLELEMMRIVKNSGWYGPVAILDHRNELDAEESLKQNLSGMKQVLEKLGDEKALETYK